MQRASPAAWMRQHVSQTTRRVPPFIIVLFLFAFVAFSYLLLVPKQPRFGAAPLFAPLRPQHDGHWNRATQHRHDGLDKEKMALDRVDVWAAGVHQSDASSASALWNALSAEEQDALMKLCGRCVFHSLLESIVVRDSGNLVFVKTGDMPEMWVRDAAVQLAVLMPRMEQLPFLRGIVEGGIRQMAYYIQQDPWACAFSLEWKHVQGLNKDSKLWGRAGWVGTRNFEVDSGAYFFNTLYNYYHYAPASHSITHSVLKESGVLSAVLAQVGAWLVEQHHGNSSESYRYPELHGVEGLGKPVGYTGMIWGGFRPSDDPQTYGYNIPANMFAMASLRHLIDLNTALWNHHALSLDAARLAAAIQQGIETHGVVNHNGQRVYAYEVDGLGGVLVGTDDPNVPSLLAIPLLGYPYDATVYAATRALVLSKENDYFVVQGNVSGLASKHTPTGYVWPLGLMTEALTMGGGDVERQVQIVRTLLSMQCGNGLMHESVLVHDLTKCTRPVFEWANSMLVVVVEHLLGRDCTQEGVEHHYDTTGEAYVGRGHASNAALRAVGTPTKHDHPHYYGQLASRIQHAHHGGVGGGGARGGGGGARGYQYTDYEGTGDELVNEHEPITDFAFKAMWSPSPKPSPSPKSNEQMYAIEPQPHAVSMVERKDPSTAFQEWLPASGVKVQDVLLDPNLDGGLVEHKLDQRLDFDSPEFQSQPPK